MMNLMEYKAKSFSVCVGTIRDGLLEEEDDNRIVGVGMHRWCGTPATTFEEESDLDHYVRTGNFPASSPYWREDLS